MMNKKVIVSICCCLLFGCSSVGIKKKGSGSMTNLDRISLLEKKYQLMLQEIDRYGPGGKEVLTVAYTALKEGYAEGKWPDVYLEELWTHALQEGLALFNTPRLWGPTTAEETGDMLGQLTVGPWQMTLQNIKIYSLKYGGDPSWSDTEWLSWIKANPVIQAKMISDFLQNLCDLYGKFSIYCIQAYFWLEPFVKGEIGQGPWYKSPVAKSPTGRWQDITPEDKRQTGCYAKQIILGNWYNPHGLLYWLYVTKDEETIKYILELWNKKQKKYVWDEERKIAVATEEKLTGYEIKEEDIIYCSCHPEFKEYIKNLLRQMQ